MKAARPTEYCGVTFRSLSEAIFARALHLNRIVWQYEPPNFKVNEWSPDFLAAPEKLSDLEFLIEYKPGEITDTYRSDLERRFSYLHTHSKLERPMYLVAGSTYDLSSPRTVERFCPYAEDFPWYTVPIEECLGLIKCWDVAKEYRFDLKHG